MPNSPKGRRVALRGISYTTFFANPDQAVQRRFKSIPAIVELGMVGHPATSERTIPILFQL
jgi:hypothetical protein